MSTPNENNEVVVSRLDLSIWNLTVFMVKLSIASIPATIIVSAIVFFIMALLKGILAV